MSKKLEARATQNGRMIDIEVIGTETVAQALGDLKKKSPAAIKVALNATARQARKLMIAAAKARYAVNAAGKRQLNDLKQTRKASNSGLQATLFISKMRNDLGYFQSNPNQPFMGRDTFRAPSYFTAKVLKNESMKPLTGKGNLSKGFLLQFKSGHIGMVQRVIGSRSASVQTQNNRPRWRNRAGNVEKVQTMGSPSAAGMHATVWEEVADDVTAYLVEQLETRIKQLLEKAASER